MKLFCSLENRCPIGVPNSYKLLSYTALEAAPDDFFAAESDSLKRLLKH
jgi:hypothetical protein